MNDSHNTTNKFIPIRFGKLFNVQIDGLKLKQMSIDIKSPRPFSPPPYAPILDNSQQKQWTEIITGVRHNTLPVF